MAVSRPRPPPILPLPPPGPRPLRSLTLHQPLARPRGPLGRRAAPRTPPPGPWHEVPPSGAHKMSTWAGACTGRATGASVPLGWAAASGHCVLVGLEAVPPARSGAEGARVCPLGLGQPHSLSRSRGQLVSPVGCPCAPGAPWALRGVVMARRGYWYRG